MHLNICSCAAIILAGVASHDLLATPSARQQTAASAGRHRIEVRSTLDGSLQPSYVVVPSHGDEGAGLPLLVILHTWSYDLEQAVTDVETETETRGWLLLEPNFRGPSNQPSGCGSRLAQRDILDAVEYVREHYRVDAHRIYLTGWSGGAFMAMLMAARYPHMWAAVSAGAGISDLRAWYEENPAGDFAADMRRCFGGGPTENGVIASRYQEQSPLTCLRPGLSVPIDLAAGKGDTQVSVRQTLRAFRALAPDALSEAEIESLVGPAATPILDTDPLIPRPLYLRRTAGDTRVTIFDGGHDWFFRASLDWLAKHRRHERSRPPERRRDE